MENNASSGQVKRLFTPVRIGILLFGFLLFGLLFFLEYTSSTIRGNVFECLLYASSVSFLLISGALPLTQGEHTTSQEHDPWHRRQPVLMGLLYLSLSVVCIAQLWSLFYSTVPGVVWFLLGLGFLLMLLVIARILLVRRSKQV